MSTLDMLSLRGLGRFAAPALFLFAAAEGCQLVSGLSELEPGREEAAASSASAASASASGGAMTTCEPGSFQECYSGPDGTAAVGVCKRGTQACKSDGSGWETCTGEITPSTDPENCTGGVDLNCDGEAACTGAAAWVQLAYNSSAFLAHSAAVTSKGEVIIGGFFSGKVNIGGKELTSVDAAPDAFVVKLDPQGAVLWAKQYGGVGDDAVVSVTVAPDDSILIAGHFTTSMLLSQTMLVGVGEGDVFVARLAQDGTATWANGVGDALPQRAHSVTTDTQGNVFVSGQFAGSIDFGAGPMSAGGTDGFVAKFASNGLAVWSKQIAGAGAESAFGVTVDSEGDVVVTGTVVGDVTFAGLTYPGNMGVGIFVGKLGGVDGLPAWGKVFGLDEPYQLGIGVARAGMAGEVVVVGHFGDKIEFAADITIAAGSTPDLFIVKLNSEGNALWAKGLGNDGMDVAHDVGVDDFGNITVVGSFEGDLDFGPQGPVLKSLGPVDGFVAKFDPNGNVLWAQQAGGPGGDAAYGVAVDAMGTAYVTGVANDDFSLGGTTIPADLGSHIFFAKLKP